MTLVQSVAGKESHWTGVRLVGWDFQIYLVIFIISGHFLLPQIFGTDFRDNA